MDLPTLFSKYGYAVLFLGSFADGTPFMLFGGFAAQRGWMQLFPHVMLIGALGNFLACGAWFLVARALGTRILDKRPSWRDSVARVRQALDRWGPVVVVLTRFVPGFGISGFIAAGLTDMPRRRFAWLNAIGAVAWAATYGLLGFYSAHTVEIVLGEIERYELPAALLLLAAGLAWVAIKRYRRRLTARRVTAVQPETGT
ncbi:MAG: DedA family protein [Geminicoccaceae bacterium]